MTPPSPCQCSLSPASCSAPLLSSPLPTTVIHVAPLIRLPQRNKASIFMRRRRAAGRGAGSTCAGAKSECAGARSALWIGVKKVIKRSPSGAGQREDGGVRSWSPSGRSWSRIWTSP
ncbi:hypothetical protein VPH35_028499 [Triticum aestivum]